MPKVSIIVPVYKAEKYIRRCLDSIQAQTMTDWECILVDDGSPDRSGDICDEYAAKDSRFRVFHKKNGGVASAKQYGLDNSRGEYVVFVDSDDWIEQQMLRTMYHNAKESNADLVFSDYFIDINSQHIYKDEGADNVFHTTILKCILNYSIHGGVCTKLIRKKIFEEYNISFPNINMTEDTYVMTKMLLNDIKICYINKAFYHYVKDANPNSLTKIIKEYKERLEIFYNLLHNQYYKYWLVYLGYRWNWLSFDILANNLLDEKDYKKYFHGLKDVESSVLYRNMNIRSKINVQIVLLALRHYHIGRFLAFISKKITKLSKGL